MTDVKTYLREWAMPHVLCPGCAHGIVLRAFLEAVEQLQLDRDKVAMVAGIGCSSRLAGLTWISAPCTEPTAGLLPLPPGSNSLAPNCTSWS